MAAPWLTVGAVDVLILDVEFVPQRRGISLIRLAVPESSTCGHAGAYTAVRMAHGVETWWSSSKPRGSKAFECSLSLSPSPQPFNPANAMSVLRKALSPTLRELRVFGCQTSPASAGFRAFVQTSYLDVKKANPDLPILIREAQGTPARAFARFEKGVEKVVSLDGAATAKEVEERIESLLV